MVVGIPTLGTAFLGYAPITMMYGYLLLFDFLRCLGHCNVEVFPHRLFEAIPILKYLIYTPTYHSLHHTEMRSNFCLFMPLYDKLWNTIDAKYWDSHQDICSRTRYNKTIRIFEVHRPGRDFDQHSRTNPIFEILISTQDISGREKDCLPEVGQWNMMNKRLVNGGTVNNWISINFARGIKDTTVQHFCHELAQMCCISGMLNFGYI